MSIRQQKMQARREAILAAALELLIEGGLGALTLRALAVKAGVSVPTIYNLIGGRMQIMRDLTVARISSLRAAISDQSAASHIERVLAIESAAVDHFISNAEEAKAVFRARDLLRLSEIGPGAENIPAGPSSLVTATVRDAVLSGELAPDTNIEFVGDKIFRTFWHCILDWVMSNVDDAGFREAVTYHICLHLLPNAQGIGKEMLIDKIAEIAAPPEITLVAAGGD